MSSITARKSIFNAEERALIRPFQATYLAAKDSNERKDIAISSILPSLIQKWEAELAPGKTIDMEEASKSILYWIRNNWRLGDSPSNAKLLVKRTDIIWMLYRDRVFKEIAAILGVPDATPDTQGWFNCRMKAIGKVIADMSQDELDELDSQVADIAEKGFPEEERPKRAARFANSRLDAAARAHYLEMGLLSITLVTRTELSSTGNHRLALEVHDNIAELVGVELPSFESMHTKALLDVKRDFIQYVKKVKAAKNLGNLDMDGGVFLTYDEVGFPIVAGYKTGDTIPKTRLEPLLRTYLRRHYYLASGGKIEKGNRKSIGEKSPPYGRIKDYQSRYIEAKYLPTDFALIDPRAMKLADSLAFLQHIAERQLINEPSQVFRFSTVATSRKTGDTNLYRPAKYPGDAADDDVPDTPDAPKTTKKKRAKKAASKADREARALQKEMEGLIDPTDQPDDIPLVDIPADVPAPWISHLAAMPQPVPVPQNAPPPMIPMPHHDPAQHENIPMIPNFGPNDAIQHPWPMAGPSINYMPTNGQYMYPFGHALQMQMGMPRQHQQPLHDMPLYPAGMPPEMFGMIDPGLVGLRAEARQLPTPRASVTPNMGPIQLRSDTNSIPDIQQADAQVKKPPRPRPKGRAAEDVSNIPVSQNITDGPTGRDTKQEPCRKTADALAAAEANQLVLPAKRVRKPKVRTT